MGRPKVLPANRLRANTACTACRSSKKRCSGSFPCTNCIHKGRGRLCIPFKSISDSPARTRSSATRPSIENNAEWNDNALTADPQTPIVSPPNHSAVETQLGPEQGAGSRSPEATHRTHPRMLRNLQGERVYVGKAASLSFLQLLRETVTQHIGPSQFSHNLRSEDMLENEAHHDISNFDEDSCTLDDKHRYIQVFYAVTSGFIYLGCNTESLLSDTPNPKTDRENIRAAIRDLMIAIGAQSFPNEPETVQLEQFFFTRGQRRAFSNLLEDPSMDSIRAFLLLSFYMFGACRRNAAFMYLGVAARSAAALGLHTDSSGVLSSDEREERSRLWMSLCVIDLLASSILGRPAATAALLPENRSELCSMPKTASELGVVASYQLSLILAEIISKLYSEKAASTDTAAVLLEKLNRWSEQLPGSLRSPSESEDPGIRQERVLGNMHVACFYHFAVILVTRPFLISTLSVRLARIHQNISTNGDAREDPAHSRLAAACIDSAVYMLQTCLEVHQSGLLHRNMGILKAFVFAAALVLGFSMFCHRDIDSEIDNAFSGALAILRMLAHQSAQAAHYLEILTMLEAAVMEQRQRQADQARQRRSRYVNRIFSLHESPATPHIERDEDSRTDTSSVLNAGGPFYPWIPQAGGPVTPPTIDGTFLDWEGMELPLWDSFPFTEPGSFVL
ncbi:uncharacterized protein N7469_007614 [Penicillium citrinum]|uniref:Zn(2)-C6 fungal-type domain-containing protein n=2 Tax=Penicillium TaxID=5073 RepID=A0A9W9NWX9_PENCI|nr:uncharacterized protein N7469_007614 [Penicillium citrinum]KAJ5227608.1 hypothetical protein N7469_007614 [Penicillium citrinum]